MMRERGRERGGVESYLEREGMKKKMKRRGRSAEWDEMYCGYL
jgi:hypothetical protein